MVSLALIGCDANLKFRILGSTTRLSVMLSITSQKSWSLAWEGHGIITSLADFLVCHSQRSQAKAIRFQVHGIQEPEQHPVVHFELPNPLLELGRSVPGLACWPCGLPAKQGQYHLHFVMVLNRLRHSPMPKMACEELMPLELT